MALARLNADVVQRSANPCGKTIRRGVILGGAAEND